MKDKKILYADLSLFIVAIIWGSGFIFTKNALDHMTPFYILGFRFLVASIAMGIIAFKRIKNTKWIDIKAGLIVGFFMFLGFAFQTVGLQYTTVGVQAFITASNVVMVPFFYWMLTKSRPGPYEFFGAILCFIGIGILSLDTNLQVGYGEFLTFLCAIGFALQIVAVGFFAKDVDSYVLSFVQLVIAMVLSFALAIPFEPRITQISSEALVPILYLAIFSTMIAFLTQNIAQKHTTSTHAAIILSLESVFGSIMGILIFSEEVSGKFIIGCMAIFISVLAAETKFSFLKPKKRALKE
ncbi:MAG: DMT family transporter [Gudongella sp.]|nr:DMT family transporter [Gudongella sp.]